MCYRNPGPRCSGYAEKLLADASQRLRDLQELINEGKATREQLSQHMEKAYAELREAQDQYDQTPRGMKALKAEIQRTGDPTGELEARLFIGESRRALSLALLKMEDRGDIPHEGVDASDAHHMTPAQKRQEPAKKKAVAGRSRNVRRGKQAQSNASRRGAPPAPTVPSVRRTDKPTQCGVFDPKVEVEGYGTFVRSDQTQDIPLDSYYVRIEFAENVSDEEINHAVTHVGYAWRAKLRGESLRDPIRDSHRSFLVHADSTKTARDDVGVGLYEFQEYLPQIMNEGTPVRKTDRAGEGTKGTRLIDRMPRQMPFRIYYA